MRLRLPPARLAPTPLLAVLVVAATLLGACGSDDPAPADAPPAQMIDVTIEDGQVEPEGQRVEVATGQEVELVVKSDAAGEIHVHSDPEEEYSYEPGTTTFTFSVERPGVVDVELHDPDALLAQLEVR